MSNPILHSRLSKSCDKCTSRKVRCIKSSEHDAKCINCDKRGEDCHFRLSKRRFIVSNRTERPRRQEDAPVLIQDTVPIPAADGSSRSPADHHDVANVVPLEQPALYVDYLIDNREATGRYHHLSFLQANDSQITSAGLAYFSESRVNAVTKTLGNDGLKRLLDRIHIVVEGRYERFENEPTVYKVWEKPETPPIISTDDMKIYICSYFSQVHPMYPFLDQAEFEERASHAESTTDPATKTSWPALFYAVLALGCQYHGGGAFEPRKGEAWKFYQMALGLFPDILVGQKTLLSVQAITAMAIFALNFSYMPLDDTLITEAARIAQVIRLNGASNTPDREVRYRTFWVVYSMEKILAFNHAQPSIIMDCDIGCPIPVVPEAMFGDYNWLLSSVSFSRLLSKAYESLFSITATLNTEASYYEKIDQMSNLLEKWRRSIPLAFRPGEAFRAQSFHNPCQTLIALRTHFFYHDASIALCRLTLHVGKHNTGPRQTNSKRILMQSARSIIELLRHIDMEAYTSVYILALLPLSAMFILFDLVIHNPKHHETSGNLALLEVAAGHFSRLEYTTGGSLPGSILAEFAYLARTFVRSYESQRPHGDPPPNPTASAQSVYLLRQELPQLHNETSGEALVSEDLQIPTPLLFPSFDSMNPDPGLLSGFNVMDLFGSVPFDQNFYPHFQ